MMQNPNWHELQYMPSLTVANAGEIFPAWQKRAAATREALPFIADISYGAHTREVIDLFRAPNAKATVIYIHGGYWRMLSKVETSFVADGFAGQGVSVALINYPLCPEVSIANIRSSIQNAFVHLYKNMLTADERKKIIVTGHSAGGHLAALHLATDWTTYGLSQNPIAGVVSLSGVFDVAPLMHTEMNDILKITEKSAAALNLMTAPIKSKAPLLLAVGGDEPEEFHRQSADLAKAWAALNPEIITLPGTNHYTIVDSLADPQQTMAVAISKMLR
jgi:arylformamidase